MTTALGKIKGLGSAKSGTMHWWMQRVTAIALVPLVMWFLVSIIALIGADHATMVAWISNPFVGVLLAVFFFMLFYHLMLGGEVVIEDYVHHETLKIASLILLKFSVVLVGLSGLFFILKVTFGS